jgi:PAS domain S-box-containing protein
MKVRKKRISRGVSLEPEGRCADEARQAHLWFLEGMDRITRAIQGADDLEQMASHVLDALLPILEVDRVWLVYPCDPESQTWRMVMERTRPELSDSLLRGSDFSMNAEVAHVHRIIRSSEAAVGFGPGTDIPMPSGIAERFRAKSQMCLGVYPKIGQPYLFGLDQCSRVRNWNAQEQKLFEATGKRLATLLTTLSMSRELQESKARLEEAQRVAHIGHYKWDLVGSRVTWSDELYRIYGLRPQEGPIDMTMVREMIHPEDRELVFRAAEEAIRNGGRSEAQHRIVRPDGEVRTVQGLGSVKRDASGRAYEMFGTVQDITDQKRAEEERQILSRDLQESKAWLEEAQRVAHVGYWVWDLETNRLIWSDETYRIFGLTPQEGLIDLDRVREMIHPDDREAVFRTADEAIRSGTRADCEHRLFRPSGEMRVVHSLSDLKKDSSGRPYQMFGTTQDITERKRAEEALQRSQFYLSEGQRLAHMGSWAFDESGHYWSDELYKIYGLDPQNGAPTVEQYLALVHPQDRASMAETIKIMQEQHRGHDLIERIVRPDGQLRYVRAVAVPVVEKGAFKGFVGTTMDVTEHELLMRELRRQQAYLAEAQSLAHIGSWGCNFLTGQNFHLSDETIRMHGFDPSEGTSPFERLFTTVHPDDQPTVRAALDSALRTRTDYDIEYRICRADDGQIRFLRSLGHHNPSREVGDYVGTTMDITERKHAEQERERLRQLESDLAHTNRLNMMGELAAALAHEIKQPIAAAVNNAGACLEFLEGEHPDILEAREAASGTIGSARRAAEIIDHIRSLFKKSAPQRALVDVNELIREIALLLQNEIKRHSVTIDLELAENLPEVVGDRVQVQQVLMNLMLNALEATQDVPGALKITSQPTDGNQLVISVSDTGLGLPAEKVDEIFDAFFTTKPQGIGMGLAISRSIVESHGGRLWATSNPGRGATFRFTLPYEATAGA